MLGNIEMNVVNETELIVENRNTQNLSYILKNEQLFFSTGYKVLQSQEKNGFIKCVKISQNGKIKLVYDISGLKSLNILMPMLTPEAFLTVLTNLIHTVLEVKNNGFMQCENINLSFDKIFVDCNNYNVHLIYLPINSQPSPNSFCLFEALIKNNIVAAISQFPNVVNPFVSVIQNNLANSAISIETIADNIKNQTNINSNLNFDTVPQSHPAPTHQSGFLPPKNQVEYVQASANQQSLKVNHQYVNNQYINQAYPPAPQKKNKYGLKIFVIGLIQIIAAGFILAILLVLKFSGILNLAAIAGVAAADVLASVLVGIFAFKSDTGAVQYNVNFQPELQGGATELLDDIFTPRLILSGVKTPERIEIVINKPEFLFGKARESVDGVVQFNNAISRVHCKFICVENRYFVVDMGSSNGTFINGARATANAQVPVKAGDRVKLANSEFVLKAI